jgi:hypothetical protein
VEGTSSTGGPPRRSPTLCAPARCAVHTGGGCFHSSPYVSSDSLHRHRARYWETEAGLAAIPASVHWTGRAIGKEGDGVSFNRDSPAFIGALSRSSKPLRDADYVMELLQAIRSEWGEAPVLTPASVPERLR